MCGIVGLINFNGEKADSDSIKKMMAEMKHRGPDDDGIFIENNFAFGFVRLSIIDLSPSGHQPFKSEDGRYTMVFNGEIFNYIELRSELIALGYKFKTKTDTEVLLNSYIAWGEGGLHKLNGMWAMAIYDSKERNIFCSRDRYGIKPFYYHLSNNNFYFASEIPSVLAVLAQKSKANYPIIFDYLVHNKTDQGEQTFFSEVKKLIHGHCIKINLTAENSVSSFQIDKWYDLRTSVSKAQSFPDSESYKAALKSAIELRLRSDVPVGVCLSGGLDSSAITSLIIDDLKKDDLNTFSAVYNSSFKEDETVFIKEYESKPGHRHYITPTAESLLEDLNRFFNCHAEPIPTTSPYAQFKVMELAANKVVVTLDGQGADEQLAGYHYFFGFYYKDLLRKFKFYRLLKEIYKYLKIHRSLFALKSFVFFLLPKSVRTKVKISEFGYYTKQFLNQRDVQSLISNELYSSNNLQESFIDHFEYKLEHLLKWEDSNSMFFSIEARVPFLDHLLVERTLASKPEMLIRDGMTKYMLREAMKGVLPEPIRVRVDKVGFGTPQDEWFRTEAWQQKIWEIIKSDSFRAREIYEVEKVHKLFQMHVNGEKNIAREIWKWINLELWMRKFID